MFIAMHYLKCNTVPSYTEFMVRLLFFWGGGGGGAPRFKQTPKKKKFTPFLILNLPKQKINM
jgi:hypothetical protein